FTASWPLPCEVIFRCLPRRSALSRFSAPAPLWSRPPLWGRKRRVLRGLPVASLWPWPFFLVPSSSAPGAVITSHSGPPRDDTLCRQFFTRPADGRHCQYEALRAVFLEGLSQKDVAA